MQSREGDHVDGELSQIGVQLAGKSQAGGDAAQGRANQVIEIAVSRRGQLERPEADVVERLVVYAIRLVGVLHQLMHREGAVVGLDHGVRYLCVVERRDGNLCRTQNARVGISSRPRISRSRSRIAYYTHCTRPQRVGIVPLRTKGFAFRRALSLGLFVSIVPYPARASVRDLALRGIRPPAIPDTRKFVTLGAKSNLTTCYSRKSSGDIRSIIYRVSSETISIKRRQTGEYKSGFK